MAARDDSVIRGSLITCLILLVLSIALNIFLYLLSDRRGTESTVAKDRLTAVQRNVGELNDKLTRLKQMLGQGFFSQAELDGMIENVSSDPEMQAIETRFARDMAVFDDTIQPQDRNYPRLPEYLITTLRNRNEQLTNSQQQADSIRTDATADVDNARKAQQIAEQNSKDANNRIAVLDSDYKAKRAEDQLAKEKTRDELTKLSDDLNTVRQEKTVVERASQQEKTVLQGTIDSQRKRINTLTNTKFETSQGEIRYVMDRGEVVNINLGSADALRPNVTFGVIDRDEIRTDNAPVKANVQVTKILGPHLAQARVITRPDIRTPIIPGDKVYSPFWAPGRTVKIALAGEIDIDDDGRPDNDAIKAQIAAAGAEVVAELDENNNKIGTLDSSVRFLVVGEKPEISEVESLDPDQASNAEIVAGIGAYVEQAGQYGITIIPGWKLQAFLRTIDDSLTTPLGSAARGDDFQPESQIGTRRVPSDIADMYRRQTEGMQQGNSIQSSQ